MTDAERESSKQALKAAEGALTALKRKFNGSDQELFELLALPYIELINKIQKELGAE